MSGRHLRVAAAQYPIGSPETIGAWTDKLAQWVGRAAEQGAQLLVFPEYAGHEIAHTRPLAERGDVMAERDAMQAAMADYVGTCRSLAQRHGVWIVTGSVVTAVEGGWRNRVHVCAPSGAVGHQDKIMMTRFERETWSLRGGSRLVLFDLGVARFGLVVCYDSEFPLLSRSLAEAGAELLLAPSCTSALTGYHRVQVGVRARALENQCYAVQVPLIGTAPWSGAVDENCGAAGFFAPSDRGMPDDGVLALGALNQPEWVYADLDFDRLSEIRRDGQQFNFRQWPEQATGLQVVPSSLG